MIDQKWYKHFKSKNVLLRLDLNVPISGSKILDDSRILNSVETVRNLYEAGAKIIVISGVSSKFFTFNTWDKFRLPKPFSTINIHLSEPLEINEEEINQNGDSEYLTKLMNNFGKDVDKIYSNG